MIYLDNSATTQPCPQAVEVARTCMEQVWGNPSALYRFGAEAARAEKTARTQVAQALGAPAERVFFTSGGTEADNWAIFSTMARMGKRGKHVITTGVEHHGVLRPMQQLEAQGYTVTYLPPDRQGRVSAQALAQALRPDTVLVSVMMVNNETGAVMPIREMVSLTRRAAPQAIFHTDAVQGFLKVPFQAKTLGADLISVSAHKIHGIKGAGALYIRPRLTLPPYLYGGGQEQGYRSGTEAMPAICAFGAACAAARPAQDTAHMAQCRDEALALLAQVPGLLLLGAHEAPHIILASLPGIPVQSTINLLQDREICVSAGSACAKGHRSHVLQAMGLAPAVMDGAFRISLSRNTTQQELSALARALGEVSAKMGRR